MYHSTYEQRNSSWMCLKTVPVADGTESQGTTFATTTISLFPGTRIYEWQDLQAGLSAL